MSGRERKYAYIYDIDAKLLDGQRFCFKIQGRNQVKHLFDEIQLKCRHVTSNNSKILYKMTALSLGKYLYDVFPYQSTPIEIFVVSNNPIPPMPLITTVSQNELLVIKICENIFILVRNVEACLNACKNLLEPENRERINVPESEIIQVPSVKDLGQFFIKFSGHVRELALLMNQFSDFLIRDPNIAPHESETTRNFVQNLMDCARYLSPLLTNLHKLSIQIGIHGSSSRLTTC